MTFDDIVRHFDGLSNASRALDIAATTISWWRHTGVPLGRQYQIQFITGGALRAKQMKRRA